MKTITRNSPEYIQKQKVFDKEYTGWGYGDSVEDFEISLENEGYKITS